MFLRIILVGISGIMSEQQCWKDLSKSLRGSWASRTTTLNSIETIKMNCSKNIKLARILVMLSDLVKVCVVSAIGTGTRSRFTNKDDYELTLHTEEPVIEIKTQEQMKRSLLLK